MLKEGLALVFQDCCHTIVASHRMTMRRATRDLYIHTLHVNIIGADRTQEKERGGHCVSARSIYRRQVRSCQWRIYSPVYTADIYYRYLFVYILGRWPILIFSLHIHSLFHVL